MVTTRSKSTDGASTHDPPKPSSSTPYSDTIHVSVPTKPKTSVASIVKMEPDTAVEEQGMIDVDFAAVQRGFAKDGDVRVAHAARQIAPKLASPVGGELNLIVVPDSSPAIKPNTGLMRENRQQQEPHSFLDRGFMQLYSARPTRQLLAPMPANGTVFTGHLGHDIYRMMNAKQTVTPDSKADTQRTLNTPSEEPAPADQAKHLHNPYIQSTRGPAPPMFAQMQMQFPLTGTSTTGPVDPKKIFRNQTTQYCHQFSQHVSCKRPRPEVDRSGTNTFQSWPLGQAPKTSPLKPVARPNLTTATSPLTCAQLSPIKSFQKTPTVPIFHDNDNGARRRAINYLIAESEGITRSLKLYPSSMDPYGFRNDIMKHITRLNQHVEAWYLCEEDFLRKRRARRAELDRARARVKARTERDEKIKVLFSSQCKLWRGGEEEGMSVADVFGEDRGEKNCDKKEGVQDVQDAEKGADDAVDTHKGADDAIKSDDTA